MAVGEGREKGVRIRELEKEQAMKQKAEGYKANIRGQMREIRRVKLRRGGK